MDNIIEIDGAEIMAGTEPIRIPMVGDDRLGKVRWSAEIWLLVNGRYGYRLVHHTNDGDVFTEMEYGGLTEPWMALRRATEDIKDMSNNGT